MFGFHIVSSKFVAIILAAIVLIAIGLRILDRGAPKQVVRIGGENIVVEVADTALAREQGLSGRASLPAGTGMLFVFPESGRAGIWMKDMKFSIDIIWIARGRVVDIAPSASLPVAGQDLPVYYPREPSDLILEMNAGFAASHQIKIGDLVEPRI